jgi:gliding motility-associated-like protein
MHKFLFTIFLICLGNFTSFSQCITAFPYTENFEISNGLWVSGGIGNTWAWGTPSKPNINTAGAGVKCWVTDGLTGSGYANCERSWVQSPCFNFTSIPNPAIAMKVFWECENTFDGATFQYSINNGTTWVNVGTNTDPVNCMNGNWFNSGNINHLGVSGSCSGALATVKHGWCGNSGTTSGGCQGGGGSNGWVVAKHCLTGLGGQANVIFRFAFGAGSSCNAYDGFAFDSVSVFNAPSNASNFTWLCNGANSVIFTNTSTQCPTAYSWNFGNPTSGASNTSTAINPTHIFTSGGTYTVTLTTTGPCNAASTFTQVVNILSTTTTVANINCFGNTNGSITATTINGNGAINYALNPGAITNTTGQFSGLSQALYTLTTTDANGCSNTTQLFVSQPNIVTANIALSSSTLLCSGANTGTITCNATGGTGALNYTILPIGTNNTTGNFNGLGGGIYTIVVADANGCTKSKTHTIIASAALNINSITASNVLCFGAGTASLLINASGGNGTLQYTLNPIAAVNNTGNFTGLATNNYTIIVKDANNCTVSSTAIVASAPQILLVGFVKTDIQCTGETNGSINAFAVGGTGSLSYTLLPKNVTQSNGKYFNLSAGTYTLQIKDSNNCIKDTVFNINILSAPMSTIITKKDIGCQGVNNDGEASVQVSGGNAPYTYSWTTIPVQTTAALSKLFTGKYYVLIRDANNCIAADSAFVAPATCCASIFIPNVFTPNNDGVNDYFYSRTYINLELKSFAIFDRFGNQLWQTNDIKNKWDGSYKNANCELGTYYYFFKYLCLEDKKEYVLKGDVILSR